MQKKWPTEPDLVRYCRRWQEMLRLQHWNVKVRYARCRDMLPEDGGNPAWGRCYVNENHFRAKMLILHPEDYEDDEGRDEIEITVVHELLHLLLHPLRREISCPDNAGDIAEEQAINVLSELLVRVFGSLCDALQPEAKRKRK